MSTTETELGPRSGHLGVAWEAAVASAVIVVIIGVIIVAVLQVRRRNHRLRTVEEGAVKGRETTTESKQEVIDLESGKVVDLIEVDDNIQTDSEDENASDPQSQNKRSRRKHTSSRTKMKTTAKSKSSRRNSSSASDSPNSHSAEYYFEHPSQKPPKYYWKR